MRHAEVIRATVNKKYRPGCHRPTQGVAGDGKTVLVGKIVQVLDERGGWVTVSWADGTTRNCLRTADKKTCWGFYNSEEQLFNLQTTIVLREESIPVLFALPSCKLIYDISREASRPLSLRYMQSDRAEIFDAQFYPTNIIW